MEKISIMELGTKRMRKAIRQMRRPFVRAGALLERLRHWWLRNDRRYGLRWRAGNALAALLLLFSAALPVIQDLAAGRAYALSADTQKLIGVPDSTLSKQLTYDGPSHTYYFNKDAIKGASINPAAAMQSQIGTASGKGSDKSLYALDVPQDMTKGVTYHDVNSGLSFSLVPQFSARQGREVDGHLVFPLSGGQQAIYTLKNNGLKEDIVAHKVTGDTLSFTYRLNLPKTLQAKVVPDSGGAIGIYAADPALYGNISYATDADRANVEKARENGEKTQLVFGLPTPVIKTPDGKQVGTGRFSLQGGQLSVIASGLSGVKGPVTVDPSVVVTSTSDFQAGNTDSNISFGTANQITRGGLTGGVPNSTTWSGGTNFQNNTRTVPGLVAYNGFLYMFGGYDGSPLSDVQYATINSGTGALSSWTTTNAMPFGRRDFGFFGYNGYLYVMAGSSNAGVALNDVIYAPLNANGTVGTWNQTTNFTTIRQSPVATAYNGYAYIMGGANMAETTIYNDVQYAPINADGTFGAWKTTASMNVHREIFGGMAYNGYLYALGGYNGSLVDNTTEYAPINADGTAGTWTTSTSFNNARSDFRALASNGYMYVMGGYSSGALSDVQYAPINANGSLGTWRTTSAPLSPALYSYGSAAYNGYLYLAGGNDSSDSDQNTTKYIKIDSAGQLNAWGSADAHSTTARGNICGASNNQYLYAIGGSTSDDSNNNITNVSYVPVSNTGTTGSTWTELTSGAGSLPTARGSAGCAISSNNILYIVGGWAGAGSGTRDGAVLQSTLNLGSGAPGTISAAAHSIHDLSASFTPVNPGVFIYNNFIYSVGGGYSSGTLSTNADGVYYAPLNASTGAVGTWTAANSLSQNYQARAFARVGNHLYAIGGQTLGPTTDQNGVETATINSNGTLSTWSSTTSLTSVLAFAHATTINGCIYVVGGETAGGSSLNGVYYNCPASDGSLPNAWKAAPNLTNATTDAAITNNGGSLFIVGGFTTAITGAMYAAAVNNGGSGQIGAWASQAAAMPDTMEAFGSTVYNGYMYIAGGRDNNSSNDRTSSHYMQIGSNGNVGAVNNGPDFSLTGREGLKMVAANGYLYIMGGNDHSFANYFDDTFSAPINANGSIGSWTLLGTHFSTKRDVDCATSYNGYVYAIGGSGGVTDVLYGQAGSDGRLNSGGAWTVGNSLPAADASFCFVANNYMYAIGDFTVYSAPVNANGSVGTWSTVASSANAQGGSGGLPNGAFSVMDGFVYLIGGCIDGNGDCTGSAGTTATQFAPIEPGGALGAWQTSTPALAGWGMGGGFAYNGYVYQFGGYNHGALYSNTIYHAPINVIDRTGNYTKLVDLGSANNVTGVSYNGTLPAGSSVTYKAAAADGVFGASTATTSVSGAGGCIGTQTNTRYIMVYATLSDAATGIFPDLSPSDPASNFPAQLNDVTINYNYFKPPPNIRLRGGQTLQTGNLAAFDTCLSSITHLQSATLTANTSATTSVIITVPSVGAGHLLVATIDWGLSTGTPACSDTLGSGWTTLVIGHDATNTKSVAVCYAATTGSGSDTITAGSLGSTAVKSIAVDEYSGVLINAGAPQLDGTATSSVTTATTAASNSITTTVAGDLIFGAVGITNAAAPVISASGSFTLRASNGANSAPRVANEDFVQSAAAAVTSSFSFNGTSSAYLSGVLAFKAAPRY